MPVFVHKLGKELDAVWQQIVHMSHVDDVFWQLESVIQANPAIDRPGIVQNWLANTYSDSVVVGLRRIGDHDRKTVSLWRLLEHMKKYAMSLTRAWFVTLHDRSMWKNADSWFDKLAGAGAQFVSPDAMKAKQADLDTALEPIRRFANDYLTHASVMVSGTRSRSTTSVRG